MNKHVNNKLKLDINQVCELPEEEANKFFLSEEFYRNNNIFSSALWSELEPRSVDFTITLVCEVIFELSDEINYGFYFCIFSSSCRWEN